METHDTLRAAIRRIAWGYLIMLLDINLGTLNILPNWLGLLLILKALPALGSEEPSARLLEPLAMVLALWEGVCWLATLLGAAPNWPLPELLATVVSLYFHFQLLTNLADLAARHSCPQDETLKTLRTMQVLLLTASYLLTAWKQSSTVVVALMVIQLIVAVVICKTLFSLHRCLEEPQPTL